MKCSICRTELEPDHCYIYTKRYWLPDDAVYEEAYDMLIYVCDACDEDLMRMYRELREDIAEHI